MGWFGDYNNTQEVLNETINANYKVLDKEARKDWGGLLYQPKSGKILIDYFIFRDGMYKPLSWLDGIRRIPKSWIKQTLPFADEWELGRYKEHLEYVKQKAKEPKLDDVLVIGEKYLIWDKYEVTYSEKCKRTYVFKQNNGTFIRFKNLKVKDLKTA